MRKIILLISVPLLLLAAGCRKYLDVNKNTDAPDHIEAHLYLAGIQQAYEGFYWDIRALGPLTQMMGTNSYTSFANHYYSLGSDAGGEIWRSVYWLQGMNLENLINQSMAAENWTLAGIGYAMKAYSWDIMTKVNGDLPMKQAFEPGRLSHDYDYQDEIYPQVKEWAYKAIELLEKQDDTDYGNKITENDYIYGGDKAKWIKFAYAVIVKSLASLTNKTDFKTKYAQELIDAAGKSFQTAADDAVVKIAGGSQSAPYSTYNNFWGTARGILTYAYFQHDYAAQVFTGTVPRYDETTGDKYPIAGSQFAPYELAEKQIITDTLVNVAGHFDPRVAVKLSTTSNPNYLNIGHVDSVRKYRYFGGSFTSATGPVGTAPSFYGRNVNSTYTGTAHDGIGKWIYRDNAPYILTTAAEIKFCLAEAYWKMEQPAQAFEAFKQGVQADLEFTAKYISPGTVGSPTGGDKITVAAFNSLASAYQAGPFVSGLSMADFSLSHIMMQKWVALYPWGAAEAWTDMRKYHYDIAYSGDYPKSGNGWSQSIVEQKWDSDPKKVYKGLYLLPAQVANRKGSYNVLNEGAPCYRIRPRYNSEYMWNVPSLELLKPIAGTAANYQTSIPWFAYPGEIPK
jgi:hypothetical protein